MLAECLGSRLRCKHLYSVTRPDTWELKKTCLVCFCELFFARARAIWSRPTDVHIFAKFLPHPVFHCSSQRPQKVKNHKCTTQWQRCRVPLRTEWSRSRNLANDLCRPSVYISTQRARRVVPVFSTSHWRTHLFSGPSYFVNSKFILPLHLGTQVRTLWLDLFTLT